MKKRVFILPLLAALILTGCSNNEDPVQETGNSNYGYIAVNIVQPKTTSSRAADGGFENGIGAEGSASQAVFVLLNGDNVSQVTDKMELSWTNESKDEPQIENISTAMIVLKSTSDPSQRINKILAVLNPNADIIAKLNTAKSITDIKDIIDSYGATGEEGSFIMTNSVYQTDFATVIAPANIAKDPDAAKSNPVDIYVERVVAKIRTNAVNESEFNQGASVTIGEEVIPLTIDIKGIQIANAAKVSYLFKNIDDINYSWAFDATNKRSYWANVPLDDTNFGYTNYSWKYLDETDQHTIASAQRFYVQENVADQTQSPIQDTSVLITAQLKKRDDTPFEFVKIGKEYFLPDDALEFIASQLVGKFYIKDEENSTDSQTAYTSITKDDITWATDHAGMTDAKGWEGYAKLTDITKQYYKPNASATEPKYVETTAAEVNEALKAKELRVWKWTDGKCYYFVEIEHFGKDDDGNCLKGIIRNHIYDLNLQSLKGLGVPVFDPEEEIIPERPKDSELFYLAARINVLKWRVVKQDVNFNF